MDEVALLGQLSQFGTAGVVGWLWLSERRASAARERELREAHEEVARGREHVEALLGVVRANTEVLTGVRETLLVLGSSIERLASRVDAGDRAGESRRAG